MMKLKHLILFFGSMIPLFSGAEITEKVLLKDDFSSGSFSEQTWVATNYRVVDGRAQSTADGAILMSRTVFGKPVNAAYILEISGFSTPVDLNAENWWGFAPGVKLYARGINFRLNGNCFSSYCWWSHEDRAAISYHENWIAADQKYDFKIVWSPGVQADYYIRPEGGEWNYFCCRSDADGEEMRLLFLSPAGVSFDAVKVTMRYDESTVNLTAAEIPESILRLLDNKAAFMEKFPIHFWNYVELAEYPDVIDEEQVKDWAECGFTIPGSPETVATDPEHPEKIRQILKWCEKYGLKMIVSDRRAKVGFDPLTKTLPEDYDQRLAAAYQDYSSYPAFMGFAIHDEPSGELIPATVASVRRHRELYPKYHPFMNWWAFWPEWNMHGEFATPTDFIIDYINQSKCSFVLLDNYTQTWPGKYGEHAVWGHTGWEKYYVNLIAYRLASLKTGIPFWFTLNCTDHMNYWGSSYNTLRWQFNTALAAGASGISWFYYYQRHLEELYSENAPVNVFWEKTPTWYRLRRLHREFFYKYGDLFNRIASTRMSFIGESFAGGRTFTPNGIVESITASDGDCRAEDLHLQVGEFVDREGNRYLMVVNLDRERHVSLTYTFPGSQTRIYRFENGSPVLLPVERLEGKTVLKRMWIAPGAERLFKVDSMEAKATPIEIEAPPRDNCPRCGTFDPVPVAAEE